MQFYNRFLNSLPNEYDTLVATYDHAGSNYSVDALCESFKAIELRRELRATTEGSTTEESIALFTKLKGPKTVKRLDRERVGRTDLTEGVRESRDIVFYEGGAPILPDDGEVVEDRRVSLLPKAPPLLPPTTNTNTNTTTTAPTPPTT